MVAVLPSHQISPFRFSRQTVLNSSPITTAMAMALEAYLPASSFLFCPKRREEMEPEPTPIIKPMACIIPMIENTIPTAPEALVLICETK